MFSKLFSFLLALHQETLAGGEEPNTRQVIEWVWSAINVRTLSSVPVR